MQFRQLFKNDKTLMYKITYKKNVKNIIGKVSKDNKLEVTSPDFLTLENIDNFVLDHFEKFYEFIENRKANSLINFENDTLGLNGYKYHLICMNTKGREKYEILGNKIYFHLKNIDNKIKMIIKLYSDIGSKYLIKRASIITNKFNIAIPSDFATKWYESKWGQCNIETGVITLANQLVMFNDEIIDYVIIHELCHLIHRNHSNEFWNLVKKYYPNYEWAKEKLRFQC